MGALQLAQAYLLGLSQSGRVAVSVAFSHPERIRKIVVAAGGQLSTGKNFRTFIAHKQARRSAKVKDSPPVWQRLAEVPVPLRLIYGKQDRGSAAERAAKAKEFCPALDLA